MSAGRQQGPWYTRLHWQIALALVAGLNLGIWIGEPAVPWVGWMGTVFIRLLRMVIVPLVLTSIISGVSSIGTGRELGRLGAKTLGYYLLSSMLAILLGLVLVNLIKPGIGAEIGGLASKELPATSPKSVLDENPAARKSSSNSVDEKYCNQLYTVRILDGSTIVCLSRITFSESYLKVFWNPK